MPRRVQDIIPNNHRSIRDIPVERNDINAPVQPPKKKAAHSINLKKNSDDIKKVEESLDTEDVIIKHTSVTPPAVSKKKSGGGSKKFIFVIMGMVILVAGVGYVASVYFSRASFTIVPKVVPVHINGTYTAQSVSGNGALTYELAVVRGNANTNVLASDGPNISTSAKGKITIYNSNGTQSQRLIAGTRFADESGRIYRLTDSIVVPGYTSAGANKTPGSTSATVVADQPGQSYNITKNSSVSDLSIVAYKGTPKYETIYGRVLGEITGGFVGTKKTVSPSILASTTAELQTKIIATLTEQIKTTLPEGYVMYENAYTTSFSAPEISGSDPKSATISVQGVVYGILFKKSDLVARIAGNQALESFNEFTYETPGFEKLDFSIANQKDFSAENKNTLIIKLKGDASLVGSIPIESLKTKLAGLSLAETSTVLRLYKPIIEIEKSSGEITPPWSKVPSDPSRITIKVLTK